MPKFRERDYAKERYWRRVFADWKISAINGAEYCRRHKIKYTQFQDWRRILARRDAETDARTKEQQRQAERRSAAATAQMEGVKREPAPKQSVEFAEVRLSDRNGNSAQASKPRISIEDPCLEIVFGSGVAVRAQSDCPQNLLSTVISLLERR